MEFEDLQKIWDTQSDRPVFQMNDSRLAVGLYQQREHSRRRLFRTEFAPLYFFVPFLVAVSAGLFLAFFMKTITRMRITDPLMSVWDGLALVIAMGAFIAMLVYSHRGRKNQERRQNVFAPTLREELEQGISQVDFELSLYSTTRVVIFVTFVAFGTTVIVWESARLNGNPAPWRALAWSLLWLVGTTWYAHSVRGKGMERLTKRKRVLESMLASLEENPK
jgi:hypothetical protein